MKRLQLGLAVGSSMWEEFLHTPPLTVVGLIFVLHLSEINVRYKIITFQDVSD